MFLSVIAGYVFQQIGHVLVIEVGVSFFLYAKIHENTRDLEENLRGKCGSLFKVLNQPNEFILRLL